MGEGIGEIGIAKGTDAERGGCTADGVVVGEIGVG